MPSKPEILSEIKTVLGEGPFYDHPTDMFYWVDIMDKCFYARSMADGAEKRYSFDRMVSAVFPTAKGNFLVILEQSIVMFNPYSGEIRELASVEKDQPGNRINDAKCDRQGRLWFGSMDRDCRRASGSFYRMGNDGIVCKIFSDVVVSNGLDWSPDDSILYYTDTQTFRVDAFDFDSASMSLSNRQVVLPISYNSGLPDGLTVDKEGMIWLALWEGAKIIRIDPHERRILKEVDIPAYKVTSLCFGGKNLNELYITTATSELTPRQIMKYPHSGKTFRLAVDVPGYGSNRFRFCETLWSPEFF